jgi:hypothetical protein
MIFRGPAPHLEWLCNAISSFAQGHEKFGSYSGLRHNGREVFSVQFKTTHELYEFYEFVRAAMSKSKVRLLSSASLPTTAIESGVNEPPG